MGTLITYPDASTLKSSALTISPEGGTLGAILQPLTMGMMGLPADSTDDTVRIGWSPEGQPWQNRDVDVCYLLATLVDDPYDKIRDRTNLSDPNDTSGENPLLEQWNYTRVWDIQWVFYGPNAADFARAVRSALYQEYFLLILQQSQLFPMSEIAMPLRVPENISGQWYERSDLRCQMYEFVTEQITRPTIKSAEVKVFTLGTPEAQFALTQLAADKFDAPDQNPLGLPWLPNGTGFVAGQRLNGEFASAGGGALSEMFYSGVQWPVNQYSQATLVTLLPGNGGRAVLSVRNDGNGDRYALVIDTTNSGGMGMPTPARISKLFGGAETSSDAVALVPHPGDVFLVQVVNNVISAYQNGQKILEFVDVSTPGRITLVTDNFNRPNENPLNPQTWTVAVGRPNPLAPPYCALKIVGNVALSSLDNGEAVELYTGIAWGADQWAEFKVLTLTNGGTAAVLLRSDSSSNNCYDVEIDDNGDGTVDFFIGVFTGTQNSGGFARVLLNITPIPFTPGMVLRGTVVGNVISGYLDGVLLGSAVDSNNTLTSGVPAIWLSVVVATDVQVDDFAGGSFGSAIPTGTPGLGVDLADQNSIRWDDWSGGTVVESIGEGNGEIADIVVTGG